MVRLLVDAGAFVNVKDESRVDAFQVYTTLEIGDFAQVSSRYIQRKGR